MTAVALPQNLNRQPWSAEAGNPNGAFMPRKSAQRSNSSSSLSSQASTTSTISAASSQSNGVAPPNGTDPAWAARKTKAPKGLWPATKTEPIAGITTARPQPVASAGPGSSAASAMSALQSPAPMVPSQSNGAVQAQQQNGVPRAQGQEQTAVLHLMPMNGTFERKTITVPFFPDVLRIGRQTNNKTIPTPLNGYFDSKVLSRQHAEVWADRQGKIWIRDVKSSNGTFVNGARLSQENRDSDPHELREQDMLELGIDIVSEDQKTIVHHKVAARVEHAGIYARSAGDMMDLNFGELENQQMANMMGPNGQQQLANMRGRTPSQGSINSQRMQGPGANPAYGNSMQQPRHPNFWLQPITMEQVVKKLNAEIKAAKQQSQELQQTHQYINAILTADPKKDSTKASPIDPTKISPIKDNSLKARFSDPPAPPPQQPLPAKPDAASSLRRSDTERQKTGSPVRSDAQMSSLNEALTSAKKEIESQSVRLRDLEAMLTEERRAREDAEERASRLERESKQEPEDEDLEHANGTIGDDDAELNEKTTGLENGSASPDAADATSQLQQRLDLMMSEMSEMKQQMERYRERAETAEADRKTLAEMIESIRRDNARASSREARRRSRTNSPSPRAAPSSGHDGSEDDHEAEEGEITIIKDKDLDEDGTEEILRRAHMANGHTVEHDGAKVDAKPSNTLVTRQPGRSDLMYHGGPVGAMVAVVAIGVAVMAMLNQYPKVER
ncbi:hypothetical protein HBH70_003470 [Parastagonospora nodorum]|nr:hypothetical protein HBI10_035340 [Parastagonospora nodorum]KAH4032921.1 hypothetical protein HBI13_003830 [Parastagonospora nodorum]KAH4041727.1 hypothetical protein HBI09_003730 [Parastagonospora nodorum]KAH4072666.1 hypothetical protein HBH50_062520 [Parastagonospora nodorum]KAH4099185.1 hypothetical protein HBH48_003840 [Parastagonospora nodorum]